MLLSGRKWGIVMLSDVEIAQKAEIWPIDRVAERAGLTPDEFEPYGRDKAKITLQKERARGKLVLVTAISPTPAGEGKSTVTVGLADAMNQAGVKTMVALREPSMGPVMGLKGGATGGGMAQVIPMADINLHFTGDFHALTSAHNTLAALIDNSLQQGNPLQLNPRRIVWKRVLDVNDRALRHINIGLGGMTSGIPRESGFDITVASELMAILTLSQDLMDLRTRIERIVIGYTYDNEPVTVAQLGVAGALTVMLKDAIKPNLVQTLEHTPALIHGGPFANIAQGTNSVLATDTALQLADFTITEAGFGADLGGEKFMDIKIPILGQAPDVVVLVATVRALKYNGGQARENLQNPDLKALQAGLKNLARHLQAMQRYGKPVLVAINRFVTDTDEEVALIQQFAAQHGSQAYETNVWAQGGQGALNLAQAVQEAADNEQNFQPLYQADDAFETKLQKIVTEIYGGRGYELAPKAQQQLVTFKAHGWDKMPVVMAKTQYSFSDDAKQLGAPEDFIIHIRELELKNGAGFIVALTGNVLTMPGLPEVPAANRIDIDAHGRITGLD